MSKPTKPAPRARARKITPEAVGELCRLIADGMPLDHACAKVGFRRQSLDEARAKDDELDAQVRDAQAEGAEWYRSQVMTADDDWKRWAWLAERLHPSLFAPPTKRVEASGPGGGPQEVKHSGTVEIDVTSAVRIARQAKESK